MSSVDQPAPDVGRPSDRLPELGILLVHGIGQQARGATLVEFAEPLHDWLRQWFLGSFLEGIGSRWTAVDEGFDGTRLDPDGIEPAHTFLRFSEARPSSHPGRTHTWLLAESWWAGVMQKPSFAEFMNWAFRIAPLTIIHHFGARFRRMLAKILSHGKGLHSATVDIRRDYKQRADRELLLTVVSMFAEIPLFVCPTR